VDSSKISRVPLYSGVVPKVIKLRSTGLSPSTVEFSKLLRLTLSTSPDSNAKIYEQSHDPNSATEHSLTQNWFRLFPFRSPLLRESRFLFFPPGTEMFQFPEFTPLTLCVHVRVAIRRWLGFPIRKSLDQRLFGSSPRLYAAYHILHRRLAPRHPLIQGFPNGETQPFSNGYPDMNT